MKLKIDCTCECKEDINKLEDKLDQLLVKKDQEFVKDIRRILGPSLKKLKELGHEQNQN